MKTTEEKKNSKHMEALQFLMEFKIPPNVYIVFFLILPDLFKCKKKGKGK